MICLHGVNLLLGIASVGSVAVAVCAPPIHRLARVASVLAITVGLTAGGTASAGAGVGVGSWSPTGAMPQGWAGGSGVTLTGGSVLAVAGVSGDAGTSTDLYDTHRGTWTTSPGLPSSASLSTAVALSDGGALLVGGATCNDVERRCLPIASAYRLNPSDSAWAPTASMLVARVHPIVVRLAGGRVLVAGGFGDDCPATVASGYSCRPLASTEVYDPVKDRWSMTKPMPRPRGGASAALLSDGTVLVVGGDGGNTIRYDTRKGTWESAGQTASARTGALLFALPGDRAVTLEGDQPYAGFLGSLGGAARAVPPRCNPSSETFEGLPMPGRSL
jgi:N-acetylneuraminic acid mutarotase